jgi:hypothetical protein
MPSHSDGWALFYLVKTRNAARGKKGITCKRQANERGERIDV